MYAICKFSDTTILLDKNTHQNVQTAPYVLGSSCLSTLSGVTPFLEMRTHLFYSFIFVQIYTWYLALTKCSINIYRVNVEWTKLN